MTPDQMEAWREILRGVVSCLADVAMQRRAWLEGGPEWWSPGEAFNQFFSDAAVDQLLTRPDNGLTAVQEQSLRSLRDLMRAMLDTLPNFPDEAKLLADPRWRKIQAVAAVTSEYLAETRKTVA